MRLRLLAPAIVAAAFAMTPGTARATGVELPAGANPLPLGNFDVVQGEPFQNLKALKGHVVKLVFFASW